MVDAAPIFAVMSGDHDFLQRVLLSIGGPRRTVAIVPIEAASPVCTARSTKWIVIAAIWTVEVSKWIVIVIKWIIRTHITGSSDEKHAKKAESEDPSSGLPLDRSASTHVTPSLVLENSIRALDDLIDSLALRSPNETLASPRSSRRYHAMRSSLAHQRKTS